MTRPTHQQLRWQTLAYGMFCHFGINTFYGHEWSDGTLSPRGFNPTHLDARQWVAAAQAAGMRYLVFTAKHHDGFCLWPTDTTDYSVRATPFRGGHGDVVGELAEACRDADMPLGLYLSPWDRHEPCYADPPAYDRFYARQLAELCTRYGPLFEIWFDGAGSEGRSYNWDLIMEVVDRHQPEALVFNMGRPSIRWVGNEDGLAADPNHYVQREQVVAGAPATERYLPPECDVSLRRGWFWQPDEAGTRKSLEHLLAIYYRSVGLGANLLLNVPPDRSGLIEAGDRDRLLELAAALRERFARPIAGRLHQEGGNARVSFSAPGPIDHLVLREDLRAGQRVHGFAVRLAPEAQPIARGRTIGSQRIVAFPAVEPRELLISLEGEGGTLRDVTGYRTGFECEPALPEG
jgi:alpha-L-fucosidase